MKLKNFFLVSVLMLIAVLSTACSGKAPVYAEGTQKDQAVAAAAPFAKDILDGIQKDDYGLYSKDFDPTMAKASTQDSFEKMVTAFAPYGEFKSSDLINVQIVDAYYRVNYKLTFASKVLTMGVVIPQSGTPAVSGLWFN